MNRSDDIQVMAGQLVAQNMLIQILLSKSIMASADAGDEMHFSLEAGLNAIRANANMTDLEKFGCEKTLADAIDTIDQLQAMSGRL